MMKTLKEVWIQKVKDPRRQPFPVFSLFPSLPSQP